MAYDGESKPSNRVVLGDFAYKLIAPQLENGDGKPTFGFNFWKNNFSMEMRTKVKLDDKEGFVRLNITPFFILEFIAYAKMVTEGKLQRWEVSFFPRKKPDNGEEPKREAKFVFTRETDESTGKAGMFFLGIGKKGVSQVKFYFDKPENHRYTDEKGEELPQALRSEVSVLTYLGALADRMAVISVNNYEHENFNQGQSNNYNGRSSGPDNHRYGSYDDDIPM